tara:strand:- start:585 stop:1253 length:669 start_codon:yes stop_codon:yes gene_type:complete
MNIKKSIYAIIAVFLMSGANVGAQTNVGITLSGIGYEASGSETVKSSGTINDYSENGLAALASIFIEKEVDNGVVVGLDIVPYGQTIADGGMEQNDDAETSGTNTVDVKFNRMLTVYAEIPAGDGYMKVGGGLLTIETDEEMNTGSTYGDEDTQTILIGFGKRGELDNGGTWKAEAIYQRILGTTFDASKGGNAVGDASVFNKITLDDVDTVQFRFSVAKSF